MTDEKPWPTPQQSDVTSAAADQNALLQEVAREGMGGAGGLAQSAPVLQSPLRINELKPGTAKIQRLYARPLGETIVAGLRKSMRIILQLGLIVAVCLSGEQISHVLPIAIPSNICSMLLLLVFLVGGVLKIENIGEASDFLLDHMSIFFIPAAVAIMGSVSLLAGNILKLVLICLITTVLVFVVTSFTVSGTMRLMAAMQRRRDTPATAQATVETTATDDPITSATGNVAATFSNLTPATETLSSPAAATRKA